MRAYYEAIAATAGAKSLRSAGWTVAATLTPRTSVRAKVMRSAAATVAAADQSDASDAVSAAGFRMADAYVREAAAGHNNNKATAGHNNNKATWTKMF